MDIRIGIIDEQLPRLRAQFVQQQLEIKGIQSSIHVISSANDSQPDKRAQIAEVEQALINERIDLAVHPIRDLDTKSPEGLCITALSERNDPSDWLIVRRDKSEKKLFRLADQALVGTSTERRKAQLRHYRPDLRIQDIQGDVSERLIQLANGDFDAILIAAAGLLRIDFDLSDFEVVKFNPREFVPSPGQGVLAYQTRVSDLEVRRALKDLHHQDVARRTNVERRVLQLLGGGYNLPLGVYCEKDSIGNFHVWATLAKEENEPVQQIRCSQSTTDKLAERVFDLLNGEE